MRKNHKKLLRWSVALAVLVAVTAVGVLNQYYRLKTCNWVARDGVAHGVYVYPGTTPDSLLRQLDKCYELESPLSWRMHAALYHFDTVCAGYYHLPARMGSQTVIYRIRYGHQDPILLHFKNNVRTRDMLAKRLSSQLLLDSADVAIRLDSLPYLRQFGLNKETAVCLFIPNSYEVYWTMSADELFARMYREYEAYWTEERQHKAMQRGLTRSEVATIASIVSSETHNEEEWPQIAALYLTRLRIGMRLQADPTVVFATGDWTIRRVRSRHLEVDSPYNTYKYAGLPPGPIRLATAAAMDAVLDAVDTPYLYMCANPDFSGTHVFTTRYTDHMRVAREYQRELSRRKIK